jgi:hypothetical protein
LQRQSNVSGGAAIFCDENRALALDVAFSVCEYLHMEKYNKLFDGHEKL